MFARFCREGNVGEDGGGKGRKQEEEGTEGEELTRGGYGGYNFTAAFQTKYGRVLLLVPGKCACARQQVSSPTQVCKHCIV